MDKLSYALGMSMGHNFKGTGIKTLNSADFAAAWHPSTTVSNQK